MPTKTVHAVPMLSPVLEDFVPPRFRGNVPDTPRAEAADTNVEAPPANWSAESHRKASVVSDAVAPASSGEKVGKAGCPDTGIRSRAMLMLLHWRKRAQRGPVEVSVNKPVQVQGLRRQKSKYPKSRRSVSHYLNPLCLLAKLRDTYINMMNNVATSGIVPGGPMGDDSGAHSTLFFSREFDAESIAQLVELERSSSKPDTEYRLNMAFARNLSRVKPLRDDLFSSKKPKGSFGGHEPVFSRSKSSKSSSVKYFSLSGPLTSTSEQNLSGEPKLRRSKSNSLSDDVFFSRELKGSRKKLHINPYLDSGWASNFISEVAKDPAKIETKPGPDEFHFQP